MQIFVKQRATETGDIDHSTSAIDVGGSSLLVTELIVYVLAGGGSQTVGVAMQTSNDLETWSDVTGSALTVAITPGTDMHATLASGEPFSRYVRFNIVIAGSTTSVEYSLVLNTHASS